MKPGAWALLVFGLATGCAEPDILLIERVSIVEADGSRTETDRGCGGAGKVTLHPGPFRLTIDQLEDDPWARRYRIVELDQAGEGPLLLDRTLDLDTLEDAPFVHEFGDDERYELVVELDQDRDNDCKNMR